MSQSLSFLVTLESKYSTFCLMSRRDADGSRLQKRSVYEISQCHLPIIMIHACARTGIFQAALDKPMILHTVGMRLLSGTSR